MSEGTLRRAEEIFFEVEPLPPGERTEAARLRCDGDGALWDEVRSLLEHAEVPEVFLGTPPLGAGVLSTAAAQAVADDRLEGSLLGRWRLSRRLASGGMGTVYEGVRADGAFEQRVAIKVVKRGMDSEEIVERFRLERQTLASLSHPNIAKLLDGGVTPDGRPYLVMEFVDGRPIDEYCDQQRLTIAQRLRLFRRVCDAVHTAHRHLVVHRDLKPGNILVGADGQPRLLDFGIAKVLSADGAPREAHTAPEQRRLTPEYASPEQIEGRAITTATDVYSLGVILYELLAGRRPYTFSARTTAEIQRLVCRQDPPAPSDAATPQAGHDAPDSSDGAAAARGLTPDRLRRRLRGDLDTIVLTAMRKEPERRYASAERLSEDVERHLQELPVTARRDTLVYRTAKFVRRHAVGVTAAAAVSIAVVLGAAGFAWQAYRAQRERDGAYLARDQAEATSDFLSDMLASADPEATGHEATVRDLLENMGKRLGTDFEPKPLVKAALMSSVGSAYTGLGDYPQAERYLTESLELRRRLLGEDHHDVAEGMISLARLRYATDKVDEAESLLRRALEIHQRQRGPENEDTARVLNDLGAVLRAAGKTDEAERTHREALRIRRRLFGDDSLDVAESLNNLSGVLRQRGDLAGAEEAMSEALRIRRARLPAAHALVAQSVANLAVMKGVRGNLDQSEALFREAVELEGHALGPDHPGYASTVSGLANVLAKRGRWEEAGDLHARALEIRRARLPAGDLRTLTTQLNLARCCIELHQPEKARLLVQEAIPGLEAIGARGTARLAEARELLGRLEGSGPDGRP